MRARLEVLARDGAARLGRLHLAHGIVETPAFMPVGTYGTVKGLTPAEVAALGADIVLGNTFHLMLRPGAEVVALHRDGLHGFMNWQRPILTDSGGFQVFSLDTLRKVTEEGVLFRSHLNGDQHLFTPESTIDVQMALGSDIMMVLDECLAYPASHEAARASTERTIRWARTAYAHYRERADGTQACFPIVQGSMHADLRRHCAERLLELDADGYAIGGLSVGEPRALSLEMTEVTAPLLPAGRPRYVMGVGMPEELPEYVARGIDMMDCVLPSRNARNGYFFTTAGRVVIKQSQYKDDAGPVDAACSCYTCMNFSRAYLRHLFLAGEMTFSTLATLHNLRRYLDIMREIRECILDGTFPAFLRSRRGVSE